MQPRTVYPLLVLALVVWTSSLGAQQVVGVVIDEQTGEAVAGAEVTLADAEGVSLARVRTSPDGRFALAAARDGSFQLSVSRLGYHPLDAHPLSLIAGERVLVEVRLGVAAVPLEPLVVAERSRIHPPQIAAFYDRMEQGRRSGQGSFIARSEINASHAARATDVLRRVNGLQVVQPRPATGRGNLVRMRGGCLPAIFVDGNQINRFDAGFSLDDHVMIASIEGVEVYRGAGRAVGQYHDDRGCGLVLVWTQRGERGSTAAVSWRRVGVIVGAITGLLLIVR
jgi:hypothetical protein